MRYRRRIAAIVAAAAAAFLMGWMGGIAPRRTVQTQQAVEDEALRQQLFDAIYRMLAESRLSPRDMPREILDVRPTGDRRYLVHMAMGEGEAWFEVYWEENGWRARGLNAPPELPSEHKPHR